MNAQEPIWPSEFDGSKYYEMFESFGFFPGRIIFGSKCGYLEDHPGHHVVFNGNIVTKEDGKIWFGDIDATLDFDKLKDIADLLGKDLYILRESDGRFENENAGFLFWSEKAVVIITAKKEDKNVIL